jgi:hypothetical protein
MSRPATAGRRGDHGSHHHNSLRIQYLGSWLHGSRMVGIFNLIAGPGHRGDLALAVCAVAAQRHRAGRKFVHVAIAGDCVEFLTCRRASGSANSGFRAAEPAFTAR